MGKKAENTLGQKQFNIATFNVRGLTKQYKQESLSRDMNKYKIDICCLQECKITEKSDKNLENGNRLILMGAENINYGNGFLVSKKWKESVHRYWKISERISVLQMKTSKSQEKQVTNKPLYTTKLNGTKMIITKNNMYDHIISIVNVYAPTSERSKKFPNEITEFYAQLSKITSDLKKLSTSIVFIAGDFNSIVGKSTNVENCLGKYTTGIRNENGSRLINFCENNNKFICNSAFKKQPKHITTWSKHIKTENNNIISTFSQIDYILIDYGKKHLLTDARTFAGSETTSDHRIVVVKLQVNWSQMYAKQMKCVNEKRINTQQLIHDENSRTKYQQNLEIKIKKLIEDNENNYNNIRKTMKDTAIEQVGFVNKSKNHTVIDKELEMMSNEQKELRVKIAYSNDPSKYEVLKKSRNKALKQIHRRVKMLKDCEINQILKEMNGTKNDAQMYKAVKKLNMKQLENPFVFNKNNQIITNPQEIYDIVETHFKSHFQKENIPKLKPHVDVPKPLQKRITANEIIDATKNMSNNKSAANNTPIELVKYAPQIVHEQIAESINNIFEKHDDLELGKGELLPLPKPNKTKGPVTNLRPITLLQIIRKILSKIEVTRTEKAIDEFLPQSQCAYRKNKSTTEIIWAYRWILAKVQEEQNMEIHVIGIDMSSAFDTIHRDKILEIASKFLKEDELRILRVLLSDTTLEVKIKGAKTKPFESNIGSPQGDSVSGPVFTIYFEEHLEGIRIEIRNAPIHINEINQKWIEKRDSCLPREMLYADDADFLTEDLHIKKIIEDKAAPILQKGNLNVNTTKTEHTILKRGNKRNEKWRKTKKLGSLLGDAEDISRRKQLSTVALNNMNKIWNNKKYTPRKRRIQLYGSLVKSILLYNCSTWGISKTTQKKINSFHRKQLRRVINVKWPHKISSKKLYEVTNTRPLSIDITERRWKMLGHVLRMNKDSPARKAMKFYFEKRSNKKFLGRKRTTIVTTINNDIQKTRANNPTFEVDELITECSLHNLGVLARNRKKWCKIVKEVVKAAYVETSQ